MSDEPPLADRVGRLESLVEQQRELIDTQRERIAALEAEGASSDQGVSVSRRTALKTGGLAGLLALGSGVANADPRGQVGTASDPLAALHTEELNGGVTGGEPVTDLLGTDLAIDAGVLGVADAAIGADHLSLDLAGTGLSIDDGLAVDVGQGLEVRNGQLSLAPVYRAPADLDGVLARMERDPDGTYVVTDVRELQAMNADRGADYRLGNDVDARPTALWNDGAGFDPIGTDPGPFTGRLDGAGHVVSGLTVDRGEEVMVGLFGQTEGAVERIGLEGVSVTGHSSVGGLAGINVGSVTASYVTGAVSATLDGIVGSGGLIGLNYGEVRESFVAATVTGHTTVGGLVGINQVPGGTVEASYSIGSVSGSDVVGGLTGANEGSATATFAAASVAGDGDNVGGLTGRRAASASYWDVPASGLEESGGGTGFGDLADDPPATEMVGDAAATNMTGLDFGDTWATVTGPDDYPVLQAIDENAQLEARQ